MKYPMPIVVRQLVSSVAVGCLVVAAFGSQPLLSSSAVAQIADIAGIGASDTLTLRATVKSVDLATRTVVLVGPQGNTQTLKVGREVVNLPQITPGSQVIARYQVSVAFILGAPGTKVPNDSLTASAVRAAPGQAPGAAANMKLVVTGVVVGVDTATNTLQLVNPSGGAIRTVKVMSQEGQQNMSLIKIGDTITAVVSEAVAIALEAAPS